MADQIRALNLKPTQEDLQREFRYAHNGGLIRCFNRGPNGLIGSVAGTLHKGNGYIYISYNHRNYPAHQLVWLYHTGSWVRGLDHINQIRHDNRIENLRELDFISNCHNSDTVNSRHGVRGVAQNRSGRFRAEIMANHVKYRLGTFDTKEEAGAAYQNKRKELFPYVFRLEQPIA